MKSLRFVVAMVMVLIFVANYAAATEYDPVFEKCNDKCVLDNHPGYCRFCCSFKLCSDADFSGVKRRRVD